MSQKLITVPTGASKRIGVTTTALRKFAAILLLAPLLSQLSAEAQSVSGNRTRLSSQSEEYALPTRASQAGHVSVGLPAAEEPVFHPDYEDGPILSEAPYAEDPAGAACCDIPAGGGYGPGDYWTDSVPDTGLVSGPVSMPFHGPPEVRAQYLLWWTQGSSVPPLVTTSPTGTPRDEAGVLGQDTSIVFGDGSLTDEARSGGRITLAYWLWPDACTGIEATYLNIGEETTRFRATSEGDPILARPYFNVQDGAQDARLIAFQNVVDGTVSVDATTELHGVEVLLRRALLQDCALRMDVVVGYRYSRLNDDLRIAESTVSTDPQSIVVLGTIVDLLDQFDTRNRFHGAELGFIFEERFDRWSLEMLMKLAFGNTNSRVLIDGSTITTVPQVDPAPVTGGLLALPSNMGVYEDNHFSMIPELGITLSYELNCRWRATFGYSLIYWSRVARPGDQIDLDVNDSQLSGGDLDGEPRPEFSWKTSDFWAQGVNFGLEHRF